MTRAISHIDTEFIENLTAVAIHQRELCELLADLIDQPDALRVLQAIYLNAEKIRAAAINQRKYLRTKNE